jgi:undecaprenol kinase
MKNRSFAERLGFALAGITEVWRREASFRTQVWFAVLAALITAALRPGLVWAALVALSVGLVLALELLNSALEYLIDRVHPDQAAEIGRAKDAAAGAVLIASAAAAIIGLLMVASVVV